jgi:hypothetical protein
MLEFTSRTYLTNAVLPQRSDDCIKNDGVDVSLYVILYLQYHSARIILLNLSQQGCQVFTVHKVNRRVARGTPNQLLLGKLFLQHRMTRNAIAKRRRSRRLHQITSRVLGSERDEVLEWSRTNRLCRDSGNIAAVTFWKGFQDLSTPEWCIRHSCPSHKRDLLRLAHRNGTYKEEETSEVELS